MSMTQYRVWSMSHNEVNKEEVWLFVLQSRSCLCSLTKGLPHTHPFFPLGTLSQFPPFPSSWSLSHDLHKLDLFSTNYEVFPKMRRVPPHPILQQAKRERERGIPLLSCGYNALPIQIWSSLLSLSLSLVNLSPRHFLSHSSLSPVQMTDLRQRLEGILDPQHDTPFFLARWIKAYNGVSVEKLSWSRKRVCGLPPCDALSWLRHCSLHNCFEPLSFSFANRLLCFLVHAKHESDP